MEAAAASYEQVPPNGKGARGHTLTEFAEAAGIEYRTLNQYRQVWKWLACDVTYIGQIGSYSLANEAMTAGRWTGPKFARFLTETPPPTWEQDGHEPHTFARWTVDALRVYLGKRPTNTTLAALESPARAA